MAITILNNTDLRLHIDERQSINAHQFVECLSDNASLTNFRYIWDIHDSISGLMYRFKTHPLPDLSGQFDVAKVMRYIQERIRIDLLLNGGAGVTCGFDPTAISKFDLWIGEEIGNVETIDVAGITSICLFASRPIAYQTNFIDQFKGYLFNRNRNYWASDSSLNMFAALGNYLNLSSSYNLDINIQELDLGLQPIGAIGNSIIEVQSFKYSYFNLALSKFNLFGNTNFRFQFQEGDPLVQGDWINVEYKCEPFIELYFINSFGAYEQFAFPYSKQGSESNKDNYVAPLREGRLILDSSLPDYSAVNYPHRRITEVITNNKMSLARMINNEHDYESFKQLITSPLVYMAIPNATISNHKFVPVFVDDTSVNGYSSRFDKAIEIKLNITLPDDRII